MVVGVAILCVSMVSSARGQYRSYADVEAELAAAEANYPDLIQVFSIGLTAQNRPIWGCCMSHDIGVEEEEPEVKLIGTMHGDEIMADEMMMNLIDHILAGYGTDSRLTNLLDSMELCILPVMNPDGFVAGTRVNGNGIDLNRSFPDPFTDPNNTTDGRQPEVAAVMNWSWGHSFMLSANFHSGSLVVNFPFDNNPSGSSTYTICPDDDLFSDISETYSIHNPPMWASSSFFHGITNGAAWYAISGGMQDWAYRYTGSNEVTIELGNSKHPPASQIPTEWDNNREALLSYIETALWGVHGLVTDAQTAAPLAATITVVGRDHKVYTDPDIGDYYRMLLTGTYDLRYESPGYDPQVVTGVAVPPNDRVRVDVGLWSTDVQSPDGGEFLSVDHPAVVTWSGDPSRQFQVQWTANADDTEQTTQSFESGSLPAGYSTGGHQSWFVTGSNSYDGSFAARSGNISNSQVTWMSTLVEGAQLSFQYLVSSESGWDFFNCYVDATRVLAASGTGAGWTEFTTALTPGPHTVTWEFVKDDGGSSGSDAVWVDRVQVTTDHTVWTDVVALSAVGATSAPWTPIEASDQCKIRVRSHDADTGYGSWNESESTFTVGSGEPIPAASSWGLLVMTLLLAAAGSVLVRRKPLPVTPALVQRERVRPRVWRPTMRQFGHLMFVWLVFAGVIPSVQASEPRSEWLAAAAGGDVPRLESLLRQDPELATARDAMGRTALHLATRNLQADAAQALLDAGMDVNALDKRGESPLHALLARPAQGKEAEDARAALLKLLLQRGAAVDGRDGFGKTPLHYAAMRGHGRAASVLLEAGADVNAADQLGRTPLHDAAAYDQIKVMGLLIDAKAVVDARNAAGETPLHAAMHRDRSKAATYLVEHGANVNAVDAHGQTPLHVVAMAGPDERELDRLAATAAEVLLAAGADVNVRDDAGRSALAYAREKHREALVAMLERHGAKE